jgi:hypothetical protein
LSPNFTFNVEAKHAYNVEAKHAYNDVNQKITKRYTIHKVEEMSEEDDCTPIGKRTDGAL